MREPGAVTRVVLERLLYVYPWSFRESVGADLVATLVDRWREARRASWQRVLRFLAIEFTRFMVDGLVERVRSIRFGVDDVVHALRQVRRAPAFHALAMLAIALGIGATTTMLTVTDAVLLRPLPYDRPDDLYLVRSRMGEVQFSSNSLPNMRDAAVQVPALEWLEGAHDWSPAMTGAGEPVRVSALSVTRGYLDGLGARVRVGRAFTAEDHAAGAPAVVVIAWGLWQRVWGGDPSALGRTVELDGTTRTIVGVMDRSWRDPEPIESGTPTHVWLPVDEGATAERGDFDYQLIGRARPGITHDVLRAGLEAAGQRLAAEYPADNASDGSTLGLFPVALKDWTVGDARNRLILMLGASLLLLLLACANVANLFLARGHTRLVELSVRGALGASRSRIARQLLTESLVLALLGGIAGVGLGVAGLWAFRALAPATPRLYEVQLDGRALALVLVMIVATGVIAGLVPAWRSAAELGSALRATRATAGRRRLRAQNALVAVEIALALVLVTGSLLLLRSFAGMLRADPGFDPADLVVAQIRPPAGTPVQVQQLFYQQILERTGGIAGVRSRALMYSPPGAGGGVWTRMTAESADPATREVEFIRVTPIMGDALVTLGMRLLAGRNLEAGIQATDPQIILLNESAARRIFAGEVDVVGRKLRFGLPGSTAPLRQVVGVVADVSQEGPGREPEAQVYTPAVQYRAPRYSLVLRMLPGAPAPAAAIRTIVADAGNGSPVDRIASVTELMSERLSETRFLTSLLTTFALLALLLAAIGTYGTASYGVTRRLREMGIRMALGAHGRTVIGMLLRNAMVTAAIGIAGGALLGMFFARFLDSYAYGIAARDPFTFIVAACVLGVSALTASLVPALRASRVDPNRVLRTED